MVNKRDAEVFIVCLSCHFDVGQFPYYRAGGTPLAFSMIHVCLQWQELTRDLSRLAWFKYSYSRDMRFSTYDLSRIYLIFSLTLTLTTQDANDRGNESSKLITTIIFWRFIKLESLLPSVKGLSFTFMLSLHLLPLCIDWESIVVILSIICIVPKFYYWLIHDYGIACSQIICI
jgi:hypothetical protein